LTSDSDRVLLPLPKGFEMEGYNKETIYCGPLAVELFCFAASIFPHMENKPMKVRSTISRHMLPHNMEVSLKKYFPCVQVQPPRPNDRLKKVYSFLDDGKPVALFVGQGLGHWITVWGYSKQTDELYTFDSSQKAVRDEDGLTTVGTEELLRLWGKISLPLYLVRWLGKVFLRFRLAPYTMAVAFSHKP